MEVSYFVLSVPCMKAVLVACLRCGGYVLGLPCLSVLGRRRSPYRSPQRHDIKHYDAAGAADVDVLLLN